MQFLPTRILDDWMRQRPLTHTVTDDLNSFTLLALHTLLKHLRTRNQAGPTEEELLALLSAQCPYELWMNRQAVRDTIKQLVEEAEDSDESVDSQASTCSAAFAPFVPALDEMLKVNDEQRWEMHDRRARGTLGELEHDSRKTSEYYQKYFQAFRKLPELNEVDEGAESDAQP